MDPERDHGLKRDRQDNQTQRGHPLPSHHSRQGEKEERNRDGYNTLTQDRKIEREKERKGDREKERKREGEKEKYKDRKIGREIDRKIERNMPLICAFDPT